MLHEATRPIAVLAQNGVDFQDNAQDPSTYPYWADIDRGTGNVEIPSVIEGTYRLTVYADDRFGQYTKNDVRVPTGQIHTTHVRWREEFAGREIWRIGTPDKSSGEFKHGNEPDLNYPLHPAQFRIYSAVYNFPTEFPDGVVFKVRESDAGKDLNYVHWSSFGGYANSLGTELYYKMSIIGHFIGI